MEVSENPQSYSIAYSLIIAFSVAFLIFNRPPKPQIQKKYKPSMNQKGLANEYRQRDYKSQSQNSTDSVKSAVIDPVEEEKQPARATKEATENLSDQAYFDKLLDAYRENTLSKIRKPDSRTDMVIRYYKKEKDANKVYNLKDFGYYVHERPAEESYTEFGSNAIFYGDSVSKEDIQIIAYVLIDAGLDIKSIALSKFHDTWKAHSVEIGTDTAVFESKSITISSLRSEWESKN